MKEKFITFLRNKGNEKKVRVIAWMILILAFVFIIGVEIFSNYYVLTIPDWVIWMSCIIAIIAQVTIECSKVLFDKEEEFIRKNKIIYILLSSPDFWIAPILVISILLTIIISNQAFLGVQGIINLIILVIISILLTCIICKMFSKKIEK